MAKGKSINLTPRTKPKKEDKYSEKVSVKREYKHNIGDSVIYLGLLDEYRNTIAIITKRSKKHISEYYCIKFSIDDEIVKDVAGGVLQSLEEYELNLANEEEKNSNIDKEDEQDDLSEEELKILENGLIPMKNKKSCYNQLKLYHRACPECGYVDTCIYRYKYKYDKVNFN